MPSVAERTERVFTETIIERRVKIIEQTLVSHNPTVDRILEACRRIQTSWTGDAERNIRELAGRNN